VIRWRANACTLLLIPIFASASIIAAPSKAWAQSSWPHIRGPNYDASASEAKLIDGWPEAGPALLWTRELGQGYSGFVIGGGRLYTQYQTKTGQFVVALDPDSGGEIWRQRVGLPWQPGGAYPGPYATPTYHEEHIFYTTPLGKAGALDAANGREIWSIDLRQKFGMSGVDFGYAISPLIEQNKMILPIGGPGASLVALNVDDGSTAWASGNDPASYCPAYPITFRGRRLIVAFLQNHLALYDAATGERLWRLQISQQYDEHSAWPLFADPYLMIAVPFKVGAQVFRLGDLEQGISAKPVWASKALSNDVCSSLLLDGHVYGFDLHQLQSSPHRASRGMFKCLELATGKTKWETEAIGQATVLQADGKLILLNDTGTLILARATPERYVELARAKLLEGICWTPPALWNGRLFIRDQSRAVCVYLGPEGTLDPSQPIMRSQAAVERFDWFRFLPLEPEFPHDEPARGEIAAWFFGCVAGVFAPAALLAGLAWLIARILGAGHAGRWGRIIFAATAFLLGLAGTTLFGLWGEIFVLTWPASLYVVFRLTLAVSDWAGRRPRSWRNRLPSAAMAFAFIGLCYGYYKLCAAIGYVIAWGFLAGFLPAMPVAVVAIRGRRRRLCWLADGAGFAIYFWCSALLPGWKSHFTG